MFSHILLRIIHHFIALRAKYPKKRIWIGKEDFKSAFKRLHLNAITAARSAVRVKLNQKYFILLSLRQPFGGAPCPSEFAVVADIITGMINDLLEDEDWDHDELYSKLTDKIPVERGLSDDIPFHPAQEMSVYIIIGYEKRKYQEKRYCFR